jgi:hypothetical protein
VTTIFVLSPARCDSDRAASLLHSKTSPTAQRLRTTGVPIGDVFAWLSALYFRGKLAYATTFAPATTYVMAFGRGLVPPATVIHAGDLEAMGKTPVESAAFADPLRRDALALAAAHPDARVVLLGSIATGKYVDTLLSVFGNRLGFPESFVGRGDMSRGGLLLRCARERAELVYIPIAGATLHGKRPPKLPRLARAQ